MKLEQDIAIATAVLTIYAAFSAGLVWAAVQVIKGWIYG
jgi:hypothetical protein